MSYITTQELRDASIDAGTLEKFATGAVGQANINRKGVDVENLQTLRTRAIEAAQQGSKLQTYLTKEKADAAQPQPEGTVAQVTKDPDPRNNGNWVSDGAQWSWSEIQPADAVKFNALDSLFVNNGKRMPMLLTVRGGEVSDPNPAVDDFLLSVLVLGRSEQIEGKYFRIAYFQNGAALPSGERNGIRIEESDKEAFSTTGEVVVIHETADEPAGYDRAQGGVQSFVVRCSQRPGLSFVITLDVDKMPPSGTQVQMGNPTSRYYSAVIHPSCYLPLQDDTQANWFVNEGFFINAGNGNELVAQNPPSATTDFIDISRSEQIKVFGRSSSVVALVAFYDRAKRFLSAVSGAENHRKQVVIPKSDFPSGAYYVRATGFDSTSSNSIITTSDKSLLEGVATLFNDRADLSSMFKMDAYWRPGLTDPYPNPNYRFTGPIPVRPGFKFYAATSVGSGALIENPAFDENLNNIGQFDVMSPELEVTQELWDQGVRYVAFSFRPNDRPVLTCDQAAQGLIARFLEVENKVKHQSGEPVGLSGITLIGASLAHSANAWFAKASRSLGVPGLNKAVSGSVPYLFADRFWRDTLFTSEDFEQADVLAIQFASSPDLDNTDGLFPTYQEYTANFDPENTENQFAANYTHAQAVDYILKKWQALCYEQRNVAGSKWYGTQHGKPCRIMFVSHWHDARSYYNDAIRVLAKRWGAQICPFDEKIGFSKSQPLQNGQQVSRLYAQDTQTIDSVVYGWHPLRGIEGEYIQSKMAGIFVTAIRDCFLMGR
ncbi:DUF5040 domain-containing protein [Alcaligenes phenolicus]|uniref:DUF5040 domain-containing protein n=1 Tax=Alcaligenes TaxID=507 RepID=UPI0009F28CD8|nr:DUF5040 domain-containing protein [Alcaligenes phenolicus]OQV33557.1 hypothetical protein BV899_05735 [Alcaligenes phenolicus]